MNKMTENGVTTTNAPGQEQYEYWTDLRGREWCQYDYRHTDGTLFSWNAKTLEDCRQKRNEWIEKKED